MDAILIRYSEIGLKGKNRGSFERKLLENIREYIKFKKIDFKSAIRVQGRIIIHTEDNGDFLRNIFGVHSYSRCLRVETDFERIKELAVKSAMSFPENSSFRVTVQRIYKDFPYDTKELQKLLGSEIQKNRKLNVNLKEFDHELGVDLLDKFSYIWNEKHPGPGGLPVGIEGKVICLLEDKDSVEAARLIMKRGCEPIFAGKDEKLVLKLMPYFTKSPIFFKINSLVEIDNIAREKKAYALVVGQKLDNFKKIETELMVLRPLVGTAD